MIEGAGGGSGAAPLLGTIGIEEAARLIGVSPSAIRLWERQGLVAPRRTEGGTRRYDGRDLSRLVAIRTWRSEGLNAAAIRRLSPVEARAAGSDGASRSRTGSTGRRRPSGSRGLPTANAAAHARPTARVSAGRAAGTAAEPGPVPTTVVAERLRTLRAARGLTLRDAAIASGLSVSFISSLERGLTGASLAALRRLVGAYGVTVRDLVGTPTSSARLVRPSDRRTLETTPGVRIEDLFAGPTTLESQLFVLDPGASSEGFYAHPGEEFMYVLEGSLGVWLEETQEFYRLEPGDALTFPSTLEHRIAALGAHETRVIWVNTPPTF